MIAPLLLAVALQAQDSSRLTLERAVDRALATHPSVAAARALRDRAATDVGSAVAAFRPGLSLDGSLNQFEKPMVVFPLHSLDLRNPPIFDRTLIQSQLAVSWSVWDFGGRSARLRAQRALDDAAETSLSGTEQQLVSRTVAAYLRVLTAREVLAAHDQRATALAAAADRVRQLEAQGKAARVDGLRIAAEVLRARSDRIAAAATLDVAEHDLAQLADLPYADVRASPLSRLRLTDSTYATDTAAALRSALVDQARKSSSDVVQLEQRTRAADAGLAAAKSTRLPTLAAQGAYIDRGRWTGNYAAEWQVGMAVSWPLYTGGSRENAIDRAAADDRAAGAQLRGARLAAEQGVDQSLALIREAHARVAALRSAVEQSAEVERIERLSLDVGSGTQTDYLDAEANLLSVRASLAEARHAEMAARVELARILGELSRNWLARTLESAQ